MRKIVTYKNPLQKRSRSKRICLIIVLTFGMTGLLFSLFYRFGGEYWGLELPRYSIPFASGFFALCAAGWLIFRVWPGRVRGGKANSSYQGDEESGLINLCRGFFTCILIAVICALVSFQSLTFYHQTKLLEIQNQILNQQHFNTILNGLKSSDPSSYAVAVCQLQHLPDSGDYLENILLKLAESNDYIIAKAAIHSLIERETSEHKKLVKAFWKLCKMASEREYTEDMDLPAIYNGIEYHANAALEEYLQDAIDGKIESIGKDAIKELKKQYNFPYGKIEPIALAALDESPRAEPDHDNEVNIFLPMLVTVANQLIKLSYWNNFFGREQALKYIESYQVFEVLTYFSMLLRDTIAPSGVYSRFDPTTLNLHQALYRLFAEISIFPDFYSGTEWAMYNAVTYGSAELYKEIWNCLYLNDPLLQGGGISSILFNVNSRGLANNKREMRIVCHDKSTDPLSIMLSNLLNRHAGITAELRNVDEFIELIEYMQDFTHSGLEKIHLLNLMMFITFDREVLDEINTHLQKFDDIWDEIKKNTHLLSFLPMEEKSKYNPKKLILPPKQIAWYDPGNPFTAESDVFEIAKKEFELFVLGKGKWSTAY